MKLTRTFELLLFLLSISLYSQKGYFNYNQIKVSAIPAIEAHFDSSEYFSKYKTFYTSRSKTEFAQPKCFERKANDELPAASVKYYYSKNDSIVRDISYNWKIDFYKVKGYSKRIKIYKSEFDKVVRYIAAEIGKPRSGQGKTKKVQDLVVGSDGSKTYSSERRVEWKYKNCTICILLLWSKEHGESFLTSTKWDE